MVKVGVSLLGSTRERGREGEEGRNGRAFW